MVDGLFKEITRARAYGVTEMQRGIGGYGVRAHAQVQYAAGMRIEAETDEKMAAAMRDIEAVVGCQTSGPRRRGRDRPGASGGGRLRHVRYPRYLTYSC